MNHYFTMNVHGMDRRYHVERESANGVEEFRLVEELKLNGVWLPGRLLASARTASNAKNLAETAQSIADGEQVKASALAWFASTFE